MDRPLVIQTEHLDPEPAAWLAERCELVRCGSEEGRFAGLLERAAGLVIRTYTTVDEGMLAGASRLKVVGRAGVGVDNVDLEACARRGVVVVNTPDANTRAVVEYVTGLMCEAVRPRMFLKEAVGLERWKQLREEMIAPRQLDWMTLGIYGLGKIGSKVAKVGAALNMRVVYCDLREIPAEDRYGAEAVSRERLLAESDVLTVHVDGRGSNRGLLGAGLLERMKKDVVFINTSRGFVVDAGALAGFLKRSPGAKAILDVHEPEPFGADYPLLGLPNALLAPHLASATTTAKWNMSWVVRDVWRVLSGQQPEFPAAALA
jgi:phosphoglycerate dehydrogenase-like enzyme